VAVLRATGNERAGLLADTLRFLTHDGIGTRGRTSGRAVRV